MVEGANFGKRLALFVLVLRMSETTRRNKSDWSYDCGVSIEDITVLSTLHECYSLSPHVVGAGARWCVGQLLRITERG